MARVSRWHGNERVLTNAAVLGGAFLFNLRVLVPGLLAYAGLLATVPSVIHSAWLAGWSLAIGAASGFVAALPTALIGDRGSGPHQGVAIGWVRTVADGGQIVGPLIMGALADGVDLAAPFAAAAALLVILAWQCYRPCRPEPAA